MRIDGKQALGIGGRLFVAAQTKEHRHAVQQRLLQRRVERKRAVEADKGLVISAELLQRIASQEERVGRLRVGVCGFTGEILGLVETAILPIEEAEKEQCFEILRIGAQDL